MEESHKNSEPEDVPSSPMADESIGQPAGHPCLDLVNTMDPRLGDHPRDTLKSYDDLVDWGVGASLLTFRQAQALRDLVERQPEDARAALLRAKELREAIYRTFSALAAAGQPAVADLDVIRLAFAEGARHGQIALGEEACHWQWSVEPPSLDELLWPVAYSAIGLLTSPLLHRVKECPGSGDCGWLFLDESKNGSRRWCSMETCGSRVKMRRHYARKRAEQAGTA